MRNIKTVAEEAETLMASVMDFHYQGGWADARLAFCLNRLRDAMAEVVYEIEELVYEDSVTP